MAERILPHIVLEGVASSKGFTGKGGGGGRPSDIADRRGHANRILAALDQIQHGATASAIYLEIVGRTGEEFASGKFDVSGLSLLKLTDGDIEAGTPTRATVMVSVQDRGVEKLRTKLEAFAERDRPPNQRGVVRPKNADLAQSIDTIVEAGLRELWRHPVKPFPDTVRPTEWEIWLDPDEVDRFVERAPEYDITVYGDRLEFPEDTVVIATGSAEQLGQAVRGIGAVRGIAQPGQPVDFVDTMDAEEQAQWVDELAGRIEIAEPSDGVVSYVTVMDTGVARTHPLIQPVLAGTDRYSAIPG